MDHRLLRRRRRAADGFVLLELHQRIPMMDVKLFENRTFTGANLVMLLVGLAMFGVSSSSRSTCRTCCGFSPVKAGAAFLPMTVLIILVAPQAGHLSDKIGPRWLMTGGMVLLSASLFFFGRLDVDSTFWNILPALLLGGVGMAMSMSPTTAAAMGSVPVAKAGVGSAIINCMRQIGGSLGVAIMGALIAVHWSQATRTRTTSSRACSSVCTSPPGSRSSPPSSPSSSSATSPTRPIRRPPKPRRAVLARDSRATTEAGGSNPMAEHTSTIRSQPCSPAAKSSAA